MRENDLKVSESKTATSNRDRLRVRTLISALPYVVLILLVEFRHEAVPWVDSLSTYEYRFLTREGHRALRAKKTLLVALDPDGAGDLVGRNLCMQREFLSVLIKNLVDGGVVGIVVDKYFSGGTCSKFDHGTARLIDAIEHVHVPIVVGLKTHPLDSGALELDENQLFIPGSHGRLSTGVIRLNRDSRKIPLEWPVIVNGVHMRLPGLALSAARIPDSRASPELARFLSGESHPLTSFIPAKDFPLLPAKNVYCQNVRGTSFGIDCGRVERDGLDVEGKIAVIGARTEDDIHDSVVGSVSGFVLQANYIEALLDERYFLAIGREQPLWLALTIAAAIIILFEYCSSALMTLVLCLFSLLMIFCANAYFFAYWGGSVFLPATNLLTFFILAISRAIEKGYSSHAHS